MTQYTYWFRDLLAAGKGPDWLFQASFDPGNQQLLTKTLRAIQPLGFQHYYANQHMCPIHHTICQYDLWVDQHNYAHLIAQLEERDQSNRYVYHTIQCCQQDLQIVRGYGGYPDQHGQAETNIIYTLIHTPGLILTQWSISYGGITYPYEELTSGTSITDLVHYLE